MDFVLILARDDQTQKATVVLEALMDFPQGVVRFAVPRAKGGCRKVRLRQPFENQSPERDSYKDQRNPQPDTKKFC